MSGTHYTLGRDKPKEVEPKRKVCKRCNVEKDTTDENFGLKWHGTRDRVDMWHVDVCKKCHGAAMSARHEERRKEKAAYQAAKDRDILNAVRRAKGLPEV